MILVVGACASGKRTYALSCGCSECDILDARDLISGDSPLASSPVGSSLDPLPSGSSLDSSSDSSPFDLERALREDVRSVVWHAHEFVREGIDLMDLADVLACKEMVLCTEVGAGVVPIDKSDREFRERAGRLTVELASRADRVVRMVCGIPMVLK